MHLALSPRKMEDETTGTRSNYVDVPAWLMFAIDQACRDRTCVSIVKALSGRSGIDGWVGTISY